MSISVLTTKPVSTRTLGLDRARAKSVPNTVIRRDSTESTSASRDLSSSLPNRTPSRPNSFNRRPSHTSSSARLSISRQSESHDSHVNAPADLNFSLTHVTKLKSDDKDFNRKGITWLDDGRLVILNYGNEALKIFDDKYRPELSKRLVEGYRGIVAASGDNVAITRERRVFFFNITHRNIYETSKCFIMNGNSYGISNSESIYAVAVDVGTPNKHISILDERGKPLHTIRKVIVGKDTQPLSCYIYLALDSKKKAIYISDVKNDKLLCVSFTERLLWERDLGGKPRGICIIGNHVVVGTTNHQLLLFNNDGHMVKILLGLDYEPESLAFDSTTNRLAVSQYFRGWVHVYQMS